MKRRGLLMGALAAGATACAPYEPTNKGLLLAGFDPIRGLFKEYGNWFARTHQPTQLYQSHSGSGKQARAVIDGLKADLVCLALSYDIDMIVKKSGLIRADWAQDLPFQSSPFRSTIVFLVRKGNPKSILDWPDLIQNNVKIIMPNPKTSGAARLIYLAAMAQFLPLNPIRFPKALAFLQALYNNAPIMDTGSRAAATSFALRDQGDVLITWENEALLTQERLGNDRFERITPPLSIDAAPVITVVDRVASYKNSTDLARSFALGLYETQAQNLIMDHYFRPANGQIPASLKTVFPPIGLVSLDTLGGWDRLHKAHFAAGGHFDQILANRPIQRPRNG